MNVFGFIRKSRAIIDAKERSSRTSYQRYNWKVFTQGGNWMSQELHLLRGQSLSSDSNTLHFARHGWVKYGLALLSAMIPIYIFWGHWLLSMVSAVLLFYLMETLFLFLFPSVIDGKIRPYSHSMAMVFRFGYFKSFFFTLVLAGFMLIGLLRFKRPLYHWHIGCLAVLLVYSSFGGVNSNCK